MQYRLAIFDFDGTLADSFPFFISTFNELARRHAFRQVDHAEIEALRGYDARELMRRFKIPPWKLPLVGRSFMALMSAHHQAIPLFPGVAETLTYLSRQQVALAIVSSNSRENVNQILGASTRHIQAMECGASIFGKAARLRKVLGLLGVPPNEAIYVGDQPTDCEAAKAVKIAFGAVSWGYGSPHAFRHLHPDAVFETVEDIQRIAGT